MYHHSFLFLIVSNDEQIKEILQKTEPLEDCDYTFQTVRSLKDNVLETKKPDIAVIYDGMGRTQISGDASDRECILVADARNPLLTDRDMVAGMSEIWVMPDSEAVDPELLTMYFGHLAGRMKKEADARKQKICFETLINSVPDISWFKDVKGAHLIVNDSFCEMVGKTKEQIYKKGHCYIWNASKEDEEVCLSSDRIIMDSRKTNVFEESIKTRTDIRLLKTYKSALIDTDGEIFGTCGIGHDVTAMRNMNTELDMILDSVPFAIMVENRQKIVMNKNGRFDEYFPEFTDIVGKSSETWRASIVRKLLLDGTLKDIVVLPGDEKKILVFDEEPILDNCRQIIGNIVTLTDITLERSIIQHNEHIANTDFLTGLNNRRNLMEYLENIYTHDDVILIMMDLDNFKNVNDTFGHEAGDRALVKTAETLRECFPEEFISRMGGDEFLVVAGGRTLDEIKEDTANLLCKMKNAYKSQKEFGGITVSAGILPVSAVPEQEREISELLRIVDEQLYSAKRNGKNRCCVYGEEDTK